MPAGATSICRVEHSTKSFKAEFGTRAGEPNRVDIPNHNSATAFRSWQAVSRLHDD
jgi:hypothetical protein